MSMPGTKAKDAVDKPNAVKTNAILVTGATHARELLSSQVPLFLCLKFIGDLSSCFSRLEIGVYVLNYSENSDFSSSYTDD